MILTRKQTFRQIKNIGAWIAAILFSLYLAKQLAINPSQTFLITGLAILFYCIAKNQRIGIYITIFLPVIGELIRLPFGPENGLLISDFFIGIFTGIWVIKKILITRPNQSMAESKLLKPIIVFSIIAVLSLVQSLFFLKPAEVFMGSLYLIRFIEYFILYLIVLEISAASENQSHKILTACIISATLIAIAGFVQLIIYPNLDKLEELGWDPHMNRLVSTWLDPNFIGGFLALIISVILGITIYCKKITHKFGLYFLAAILTAALVLTYSRSAYLALGTVIILLGVLKSPKLIVGSVIIALLAIGFVPRASQRLEDLNHSIGSFIFNTAENPDATARLRIKSWEQTLDLIKKRPILGSGYNTLRYVKYNQGFVEQTNIHSAGGSDSSLLTILATTGIFGLITFCWLYFEIIKTTIRTWRQKQNPSWIQGLGLGLFCGVCGLLVHSIFVNSLLFPQIMIFVLILEGITEAWAEF